MTESNVENRTMETPEIYEYPGWDKYLAAGSAHSRQPFEVIARQEPSLGDRDGGP